VGYIPHDSMTKLWS